MLADDTAKRLFPFENPIGRTIWVGSEFYVVIGQTKSRMASAAIGGSLDARDYNLDAYIPLKTLRHRVGDLVVKRVCSPSRATLMAGRNPQPIGLGNHPGPNHPTVRWKAHDLEQAVVYDLAKMRMATPEVADWFRTELCAAVSDLTAYRRRQATSLAKRKTELVNMQDRLLNAYLTGTVDEGIYKAKSNELKSEAAATEAQLDKLGDVDPARGELAVALFDWTQKAADVWRGSNNAVRREILDAVCLNRCLNDVNLVLKKRKPFDKLAEGPFWQNSRDDRI